MKYYKAAYSVDLIGCDYTDPVFFTNFDEAYLFYWQLLVLYRYPFADKKIYIDEFKNEVSDSLKFHGYHQSIFFGLDCPYIGVKINRNN